MPTAAWPGWKRCSPGRDLAGERVELTLLSPDAEFVYRPMAIAEPFGRGRADRHPLADIAADVGAELIREALVEVEPGERIAITRAGQRLAYDAVCLGACKALPRTGRKDARCPRR